MEGNKIITLILGVCIISYGAYILVKSIRNQLKGECIGCSCSEGTNCNYSFSCKNKTY